MRWIFARKLESITTPVVCARGTGLVVDYQLAVQVGDVDPGRGVGGGQPAEVDGVEGDDGGRGAGKHGSATDLHFAHAGRYLVCALASPERDDNPHPYPQGENVLVTGSVSTGTRAYHEELHAVS